MELPRLKRKARLRAERGAGEVHIDGHRYALKVL